MDLNSRVQQLTSENYEFKFGEYFSKGWEYFSAKIGLFIGFFVVNMLIVIASSLIPVIGGIASQFLAAILLVGYFIVCHAIKNDQQPSFDHFFKGFKSAGNIILVQLILFGFTIILIAPLMIYGFTTVFSAVIDASTNPYFSEPENPFELFRMFDLMAIIPLAIITYIFLAFMQTIYMYATTITHFYKSSPWASMEASRKVVQKKFFFFFGIIILIGLINILGAICLLVGLLFTVPLSYCIMYAAFEDIFKPTKEQGLTEVTTFENRSN